MLLQFLLLFFLLLLLFLLTRQITQVVYILAHRLTKQQRASVWILALFLLPGTFIHELSHLMMAMALRVPAGGFTVWPAIDPQGYVRAGRVMIAKVDPFRRTIIGIAPMLIGLTLLFFTGKHFFPLPLELTTSNLQLTTLLGLYLFFVISTTMFSSRKDLESLVIAGPVIATMILIIHGIGIRIVLDTSLTESIASLTSLINTYLLLTLGVDGLLLGILTLLQKLFSIRRR